MITQNKGEWSELYVFLKLLGDGGIYAADADLNKMEDLYYPLIKILREENRIKKEYLYDSPSIKIIDASSQECLLKLPVKEFQDKTELLLSAIKKSDKTFTVPEVEDFMRTILCSKVKADSSDKTDITVILHDNKTYRDEVFGFSIKSKLGSASTLLNAGKTTNFIFEIIGDIDSGKINEINSISTSSKVRDRLKSIYDSDCTLEYRNMENANFKANLQMIDTQFPALIARYLICYYCGEGNLVRDLTQCVKDLNPCDLNSSNGHEFYEYKIKNFLTDVALGMTPATPWTGKFQATGGYIIVREDGEVLCYHIYNHNEFKEYLFNNTKFETPSITKYDFGKIYQQDDKNYIKLNLQVRFV